MHEAVLHVIWTESRINFMQHVMTEMCKLFSIFTSLVSAVHFCSIDSEMTWWLKCVSNRPLWLGQHLPLFFEWASVLDPHNLHGKNLPSLPLFLLPAQNHHDPLSAALSGKWGLWAVFTRLFVKKWQHCSETAAWLQSSSTEVLISFRDFTANMTGFCSICTLHSCKSREVSL
jgi:hypothetical protein